MTSRQAQNSPWPALEIHFVPSRLSSYLHTFLMHPLTLLRYTTQGLLMNMNPPVRWGANGYTILTAEILMNQDGAQ